MNESTKDQLKVLIVEDSPLITSRIRNMLNELPMVTIVGVAANTKETLAVTKVMEPDVVLLNITVPGKNALQLLKGIKDYNWKTKVIMLNIFVQEYYRNVCKELGADYLFDKATEIEKVPAALISIYNQEN